MHLFSGDYFMLVNLMVVTIYYLVPIKFVFLIHDIFKLGAYSVLKFIPLFVYNYQNTNVYIKMHNIL